MESILVSIYQGDAKAGFGNVPIQDCTKIAEFDLHGFAGYPVGKALVEVIFDIDDNGCLSVTAVDKAKGHRHAQHIKI
jgi:molecular chaperone HscA